MQNIKYIQDLHTQICGYDIKKEFSKIVIFCVGTNKVTGDCLGPLTGQMLGYIFKKEKYRKDIKIYGNMVQTLNLKNAKQVLKQVLIKYENPFIITIDAALSEEKMINEIVVSTGKMKIGNSLGHDVCYDSHINIKGVVGKYENNVMQNMDTLMNVKKETVKKMSMEITAGLYKLIKYV